MKINRIATAIIAYFSFLFLNVQHANSDDNITDIDKKKPIKEHLTFDKQNKHLTYLIPTVASPENQIWWHRIRAINKKISVSLSEDRKHLLIDLNEEATNKVEIDIQSQLVPKSDLVLKMNQIQLIGTHNSYHIAPVPQVMKIIKSVMPGEAANISYTHRSLTDQLNFLGIRKLELDVFHDTKGGAFTTPLGAIMAARKNWKSLHPEFDTESMMSPGMKIIHFPDFDFRSNTPTLKSALSELNKWSKENNLHLPIMILIETKKTVDLRKGNKSSIFESNDFRQLEKEISDVLEPDQIITPNKVQGGHKTLNQAIQKGAWPLLAECRGKFILALDNQGVERTNYLKLHPGLQGALLFVSSPPGQPESAFLKINDPMANHSEIQKRIMEGYLIRTRADSDLTAGRTNDYRQMN
ncbi:MAG TPA: Ca2+-dependent phosphoinositide-specific phospholipase C, partial [Verrucomicrobiota bacterium]|nr:Ca2+-dependent phosphoinositide-specific phospholipase C [Verrucomicrobiota bacterium]